MNLPFVEAVASALGTDVVHVSTVSGGDTAAAHRLTLADARTVFAKTHPSPPPLFFTTEAAGLEALRTGAAVAIPQVLAVSDEPIPFLVLEWIDEGPRSSVDEAGFGASLAGLHRVGAPSFGREDRRTTGSRALPNEPCATWSEFYATQRLLPLARLASDTGSLPAEGITALERLAARLSDFDDDEAPSLLHGDLWAGNRIVDQTGASWLIDPAMHGGHREFDLAMMRLFGGFGSACFEAYDETHPLADGWQDRVPLHQIAPLVVHAIKFGGGYAGAATDAIARYV